MLWKFFDVTFMWSKYVEYFKFGINFCKDQFWLGPQTGLSFGPTSPNNKFVERGKKN